MAFIIDEKSNVIVQGITGREGSARARYMLEYGTRVIAGVTPGKGGSEVWGIPVYDSVREIVEEYGKIDVSAIFVPGPLAKNAAVEAIENGVKTIIMCVERVPLHDTLYIVAKAKKEGCRIIGPGSLGVISPDKAVVGWIGGDADTAKEVFKPGNVAVISRSGGQTTTISWVLSKSGIGISTAVHTGTEPILGTSLPEYVLMANEDKETDCIVIWGEIGGIAEEETAEVIREYGVNKQVIAYIAGATLPSGIRFSHASAIVEGRRGSYESKRRALERVGAIVVDSPREIVDRVREVLS